MSERSPRGEYVVVIEGAEPAEVSDEELGVGLRLELDAGASRRDAIDRVSDRFAVPRNRVYDLALALGE